MPVIVDFVNAVPPPLTTALVRLAPLLAVVRNVLQLISWRTSWYDAWLALALWWAVCLLADFTLRYLLPAVLVVALCIPPRPRPLPTTEQSLQNTVADLNTIYSLLPSKRPVPPSATLLRIAALTYVPYLLITYFVPLHILVAVLGTVVITARAPFTHVIISTLLRSAWLRWSLRYLLSLITGHPLPPVILSHQPMPTTPTPVPSLRFLFTVYENQRWWMGLDWTAALLPGERPSWCSPLPSQQPVSPPNAFTLPAPTTVFLADGKGGRVKRTATWRWEEPEWKVVVHRDGGGLSRVERPIPEDNPTPAGASGTTGSRLLKAAGKMRESGLIGGGNGNLPLGEGESGLEEGYEDGEEDDITTDPDGWVYGDNKWEGASCKGGMGKYTRHRRWTRVAIVSETVEMVEEGPVGIERVEGSSEAHGPSEESPEAHGPSEESPEAHGPSEESPLRLRLRRALAKPSSHLSS
ncbi:hypothetical protein D9615_002419 [Tricholomella constricta]|uniref:TECPR1-like DysF domain-containing protein n=1 Tax=Tricholomella constricta TaxID=117010 RepID=A0A8H5HMB3_9AGAR|nr:hypothetical protein D9615_002419 [Tricholomella constricta]